MNKPKSGFIRAIKEIGIDKKILDVISKINREKFFDEVFRDRIYSLEPVPIGNGQTSEDPLTLARMIRILSPAKKWKLLEIGSGSGYSTSILASLVSEVVTVEYFEDMALKAKRNVLSEGISNVRYYAGDAGEVMDRLGEFDGVIIFAACTHSPYAYLNALKDNGRAVFPMGPAHQQQITLFNNIPSTESIVKNYSFFDLCMFELLIGKYGWIG